MAEFDRTKKYSKGGSRGRGGFGGRRKSRDSSSGRSSRGRKSFGSGSRGRGGFGDRGGSRGRRDSGRSRGNVEMTQVTCSACGAKCEVPFKPTTSKPLFCDDCFAKQDKDSSGRGSGNKNSGKDLKIINQKLDKIMKALKIE
tara:strand:- start:12614 stop:13039 length:426 start_codon:yes stop_codon:yes gene_type:complete